jgi:hypothetical protein
MRIPALKAVLLSAALALPAAAQNVPPGDRILENAFYATDIPFLYDPGPVAQPQLAGFNLQTVNGFGSGYVYDFCADFFTGADNGATYQVTSGFNGLAPYESEIRALFSNALPGFNSLLNQYIALNGGDWAYNATYAAQYDQLQGYAAGMQIALWEIIHEQTSDLSIDDDGLLAGSFRIDVSNPPNARADLGDNRAEEFLTNIRTGTWTDQGSISYYFADGGSDQDRLWMVVPEPSTALLGAFGLLALLRRRRA